MNTARKLNNILALRAFAATTVAILHTKFTFPHMRPFGEFGVDLFFVISGYIMARILDPSSDSSSDFFFRRRVLHIVPPYWFFTLLLVSVALLAPQFMGNTRPNGLELLKSLLFIPFLKQGGQVQPLLFLGWTLNYDMFFYFALAIGLLISGHYAAWVGSAIVLAIMLGCVPFSSYSLLTRFYSNSIVIEFVLGVVCYYLCSAIPDKHARSIRIPLLVVCMTCSCLLIAVTGYFPPLKVNRVLTLGSLSFFLVGSAGLLSQSQWDIRLSWVILIGDASYVLYLFHPYCELPFDRIPGHRIPWLNMTTATGAAVTVTLSVLLSVLVHVYGERPAVRFLYGRFGGKRKRLEFAAAVVP